MRLPAFRYHPDPLTSGSVTASDSVCRGCGRPRGLIYVGSLLGSGAEEIRNAICPWCIADGTAHARFDAEFTRIDCVGLGYTEPWAAVPREVAEEVAYCTPGFTGWQTERWFTHCGDAAAFIGVAGCREVLAHGPATIEAIRRDCNLTGMEWDEYFRALERNGSPSAYLFRCLRCGVVGGYSDCH